MQPDPQANEENHEAMICHCKNQYAEYLLRRDDEVAKLFATGQFPPKQQAFQLSCAQPCEEAKNIVSRHLQAETQAEHQMRGRQVDPQHFRLLLNALVFVDSFFSPSGVHQPVEKTGACQ
jgi:hypothetical protein